MPTRLCRVGLALACCAGGALARQGRAPALQLNALQQEPVAELPTLKQYGSMDRIHNNCHEKPGFMEMMGAMRGAMGFDREARIRAALQSQVGPSIMVVGSQHISCLMDNFLVHLQAVLPNETQVLWMALDMASHEFCRTRQVAGWEDGILKCVDLSGWVDGAAQEEDQKRSIKSNGAPVNSCPYIALTWTKPMLLWHAARVAPHGVLLIDADIVVHGDLLDWVRKHRRPNALIVTGDDGGYQQPNSGTVFADASSLPILELWNAQVNDPAIVQNLRGEQEALRQALEHEGSLASLQTIPRSVVGQCTRPGTMATHYNCFGHVKRMQNAGVWKPHDVKCL